MVSVRPRKTPPAHNEVCDALRAWLRGSGQGSDTTVTTLSGEQRGTRARSGARCAPDGRTGLRTGMCHTAQSKCAVVHIVNSPGRVKRVATMHVRKRAVTVDRGSVLRRTLSRWHRRRACRSIQEDHPCRAESAHVSDAASWYTSQRRSTAASSVVRSIPRDTNACAIRHAERLRVRYRCCASCASTSRPQALTRRHS